MQSNRRELLHLIAVGRITPGEAERLIRAWNDGREMLFLLAAVVIFAAISQIHGSGPIAVFNLGFDALLSGCVSLVHTFIAIITHIVGGKL